MAAISLAMPLSECKIEERSKIDVSTVAIVEDDHHDEDKDDGETEHPSRHDTFPGAYHYGSYSASHYSLRQFTTQHSFSKSYEEEDFPHATPQQIVTMTANEDTHGVWSKQPGKRPRIIKA